MDDQKTWKETTDSIINPDTALEVEKNVFIPVPYVPGLSEEFRSIFQNTSVKVFFKGANTLKSILMYPKDKIPSEPKQNTVYKLSWPEENQNFSYMEESSRCLENE